MLYKINMFILYFIFLSSYTMKHKLYSYTHGTSQWMDRNLRCFSDSHCSYNGYSGRFNRYTRLCFIYTRDSDGRQIHCSSYSSKYRSFPRGMPVYRSIEVGCFTYHLEIPSANHGLHRNAIPRFDGEGSVTDIHMWGFVECVKRNNTNSS